MKTIIFKKLLIAFLVLILISMMTIMAFLNVKPYKAEASILSDIIKQLIDTAKKIVQAAQKVLTYENLRDSSYKPIAVKTFAENGYEYELKLYRSNFTILTNVKEIIRAYHNPTDTLTFTYTSELTSTYSIGYSTSYAYEAGVDGFDLISDTLNIAAKAKVAFGIGTNISKTIKKGQTGTITLEKQVPEGIYAFYIALETKQYIVEYRTPVYADISNHEESHENEITKNVLTYSRSITDWKLHRYVILSELELNSTAPYDNLAFNAVKVSN
ncbi:MAG: hypothetical protein LBF12_05935 [Christensenellaceae bacterium]|jgi:hypothetical protein|nr:hypothetical protein [Christensenellaceae bacterium]